MSDPQAFKLVVAEPTSNDPPDNPIATYDHIIGINPPYSIVKDLPTPYDYQAVGDGVADDTIPMQAWLDAIAGTAGFLQTGTYAVSDGLLIHGNTRIYGAGRGVANVVKLTGFPNAVNLLLNSNLASSPAVQIDNNISISDVTFQGSSTEPTPPGVALMQFIGCKNMTFRDCGFAHIRRSHIVFSNCTNIVLDGCEFSDWGSLDPVVGDPGLYEGGPAILMYQACIGLFVNNCYFHDGQWGAIALNGIENFTIQNTLVRNVMEWGYFGGPVFGTWNNCITRGVRKKAVAAHGFELGGSFYTIEGCIVNDTDRASIYINGGQVVNLIGNMCDSAGQLVNPTSGDDGTITLTSLTRAPNNVTVQGNQISGRDFKSSYGIAIYNFGGGVMDDILVTGNNLGPDTAWRGAPMWVDDNVAGAGFMIRANRGAAAFDISTQVIEFTIPSGWTAPFTVSSIGFKASYIEFQTVQGSLGAVAAGIGRQAWTTGWDITTSTITTGRTYFEATGMWWASDDSADAASDSAGRSSISVYDALGHPICVGSISALQDDGFTVTLIAAAAGDVNAAGTGYATGDTGLVGGGDGLMAYTVKSQSGGAVSLVELTGGSGYASTTGATTSTGGSQPGAGTGLTLDLFLSLPTTQDVIVTAICHA